MSKPSSFGDFWPIDTCELDKDTREDGWSDRLRLYYLAQTPEEQVRLYDYGSDHVGSGAIKYSSYAIQKFLSEPGTMYKEHGRLLSPIEPHEAPIYCNTEKSYTTLGSLIMSSCTPWAVDATLKAIIERLEPGVHQFFPIEIRMPRSKVYPVQ